MVWGGIHHDDRTRLPFIEDILNAARWVVEICRAEAVPNVREYNLILRRDNVRRHTFRIITDYPEREDVIVLAWPAYSPDLNLIEHPWDNSKKRVESRDQRPQTPNQLRAAFWEEGDAITQEEIRTPIRFLPGRCRAIEDAFGGHARC